VLVVFFDYCITLLFIIRVVDVYTFGMLAG
jgi:hypothetical protein